MKASLQTGVTATHSFLVTDAHTVPRLPIGNELFQDIPGVLATAMMVAMMEATATKALAGHLDAGEGSVGVIVDVSHTAATVPGQIVTVTATVTVVEGRKVTFDVTAHDGIDSIGTGRHQRAVVPWPRFAAGVGAKAARVAAAKALD